MISSIIPKNEEERLASLYSYNLLDTLPETIYDEIVYIASSICQTPISLISLVDKERCWFKAKTGTEQDEAPRQIAFAAHAINDPHQMTIVEDALKDERFCDCPLVLDNPPMRFYAGTPLVNKEGFVLGTLCVVDHVPRKLTEEQKKTLYTLAKQVVAQFELRRNYRQIAQLNEVLAKNITQLKQAEDQNLRLIEQLKEKNKELDSFAYIASHDLQAPLRTITSFIDIFKEDYEDKLGEDAHQNFFFIQDAAQRMQNMITGLLSFSRIGRSTEFASIDMNVILQSVQANLSADIQAKQAIIESTLLPTIKGLKTELIQLLQNLLSNALKFIPTDTIPQIQIMATELDTYWQFSVKDNGIGIFPRHHTRILEMFSRLHAETKYQGQGIGLAFCKKIVELHHGKIWVTSDGKSGSTFFFTIKKDLS